VHEIALRLAVATNRAQSQSRVPDPLPRSRARNSRAAKPGRRLRPAARGVQRVWFHRPVDPQPRHSPARPRLCRGNRGRLPRLGRWRAPCDARRCLDIFHTSQRRAVLAQKDDRSARTAATRSRQPSRVRPAPREPGTRLRRPAIRQDTRETRTGRKMMDRLGGRMRSCKSNACAARKPCNKTAPTARHVRGLRQPGMERTRASGYRPGLRAHNQT